MGEGVLYAVPKKNKILSKLEAVFSRHRWDPATARATGIRGHKV